MRLVTNASIRNDRKLKTVNFLCFSLLLMLSSMTNIKFRHVQCIVNTQCLFSNFVVTLKIINKNRSLLC